MLTWLSIWVPIIGAFLAMCFMTWLLFWDRPASEPVPESESQGPAPLPKFDRLDDALWYALQVAKGGIKITDKWISYLTAGLIDQEGMDWIARDRTVKLIKGESVTLDPMDSVIEYLSTDNGTKDIMLQIRAFSGEYAA